MSQVIVQKTKSRRDARLPVSFSDGSIMLLDQRKIPDSIEYVDATALDDMVAAIKDMVVRGAPSIGVAAGLALAVEADRLAAIHSQMSEFRKRLQSAKEKLQHSRPTAVNLRWATERIFDICAKHRSPSEAACEMVSVADGLIDEHIAVNRELGRHGASLIERGDSVLTHCNAGALAACGWGTALGVIRSAAESGRVPATVYVDETRPRQQGARLTVWELMQDGLVPTLITDNMAGYLMALGKVDLVIVGADRIATNGDVANKIGTYSLAVLARAHNVPFYVAAPISTIDAHIGGGKEIPIEERDPEEVLIVSGMPISVPGTRVFNPSFDVTPADLVTAIITEKGVLRAPYEDSIAQALS